MVAECRVPDLRVRGTPDRDALLTEIIVLPALIQVEHEKSKFEQPLVNLKVMPTLPFLIWLEIMFVILIRGVV